jgi:hypothetical protein
LRKKTTTRRSRTRWVVPRREGSALLGPKVGHAATPSHWGVARLLPLVHGATARPPPGSGGDLRANPFVWAVTHCRLRSTPTTLASRLVATVVAGWVGEVVMERGCVLVGWVSEFGVIVCFHPLVIWCAKLTC